MENKFLSIDSPIASGSSSRPRKALAGAIILSFLAHIALSLWEGQNEIFAPIGKTSVNVSLRPSQEEGDPADKEIVENVSAQMPREVEQKRPELPEKPKTHKQNSKESILESEQKKTKREKSDRSDEVPKSKSQDIVKPSIRDVVLSSVETTRALYSEQKIEQNNSIEPNQPPSETKADEPPDEKPVEVQETEPEALELIPKPSYVLGSADNPEPKYPPIAAKRGWQGTVVIGVNVDPNGGVESLLIIQSSHYGVLDYTAWETVQDSWTFKPAQVNGKNVASYIEIPISFQIK
ncbi:hypothetical protein A3749_12005 [Oleiphilus sp. HI0078]|jgi:TonB family protein|uniref:energy transducer TonB n=2 Tax=unclassified Oleiphilus TaxID=2631174 RepID=UPI0007C3163B|nr:energy transducer TonB [Oleiphilus sp. HI0132]KZY34136.1 hypothetical protein A3729_00315 [Oleiphilus sp. HI0043]KZY60546.1 hypothetical protein A3735_01750 [Oleiphilus sp. HI0061]KZY76405.1 hypothetical protein A3741_10960 [Oleiphilus sp. HI0069]KZY84120.1 hypothetical protein A3740_04750 [Oleiphilus sp. HI0068]KZZ10089.1 hypothetical protein A3749_12005 [Oleiphilus sp. HI0078]KZZ36382.1 hypothetical protein A3757_02275 [Oleiphilus sp. HI0117]KZZ38946.1 hypothetical protein A3756_09265 [